MSLARFDTESYLSLSFFDSDNLKSNGFKPKGLIQFKVCSVILIVIADTISVLIHILIDLNWLIFAVFTSCLFTELFSDLNKLFFTIFKSALHA